MSATGWKITNRLDRAGEFSFQMSVADPKYVSLGIRMRVRAWEMINGTMTQVGLGIVDHIQEDSNANPSTATVSGANLMRELTWRSVNQLLIAETGYVLPEDVHYLALDGSGSGNEANPNLFSNRPLWYDGDTGTWSACNSGQYDVNYLVYSRIYAEVKFVLHTFSSGGGNTTQVQFFNGLAWVDLTYAANNFVDGTVSGQSFKQNGSWTFTAPATWVPLVQNCAATGAAVNNKNGYWLRFFNYGGTAVEISEVTIKTNVETLDGASLIMALAPAGWSLTGYSTTVKKVYLQLGDGTVLDALNQLADITGEHFRLSGIGSAREIEWLRTDATASGVIAFRNGDPALVATSSTSCLISTLQKKTDSFDMVTRVIPFGSGQGAARTTLLFTTRTAPSGYTLSAASNYLKNNAADTTYGQIEKVQTWTDIGPVSTAQADQIAAANTLFDAAYYWLSTHCTAVTTYALTVYALSSILKCGDTIRVIWLEIVDGVAIRNIDLNLIILEQAATVDDNGTLAVALTVSDLARWPMTETDFVASLHGTIRGMTQQSQPMPLGAVRSATTAIQVKATASGFGGLTYG